MDESNKKYYLTTSFGVLDHDSYNDFLFESAVNDTPHFLIKRNGEVKIYDPNSNIILFEDYGPLKITEEKTFVDHLGTTYKDTTSVVNILWRGHEYWSEITDKQIESFYEIIGSNEFTYNENFSHLPLPNPILKIKLDGK